MATPKNPNTRSPPGRRRRKRARIASCCATRTADGCRAKLPGSRRSPSRKLTCAVGIHTHNDCGFGVANAIAGIEAGATQVQGTINGYGERTGNCNLISVIPTLELKMGLRCVPSKSLPKLKELSEFVNEIANVRHDVRAPWVGQTAFAHKGGMHVHAIERVARSYEHINPESVGNFRRVLVSDMSGRTNILMKAKELGFKLAADAPESREITAKVKELEGAGYEYEAAEASLALLIRGILDHNPELLFTVESYHVSMRRDKKESICEATVKVRVGKMVHHTVAEGDGPVNALDGALRRALVKSFPQLKTGDAHGLQGAHHQRHHRHRRQDPRAHHLHRRQTRLGHGRREREHHRSQLAGAGGLDGIRVVEEMIFNAKARGSKVAKRNNFAALPLCVSALISHV